MHGCSTSSNHPRVYRGSRCPDLHALTHSPCRPNTFDIDPQLLEKRYKGLQWNLHPDKMGRKAAEEQEFSAQHASNVNLAYSVLKSPLSRANYMVGTYVRAAMKPVLVA